MIVRHHSTARTVIAGCFECNGSDAIWYGKNAQGVAARHHDATGHCTWVDVNMSIFYGKRPETEPCDSERKRSH